MSSPKYFLGKTYDLRGPNGNVFSIIAIHTGWLKQLDVPAAERKEFVRACTESQDYTEVLQLCRDWCGTKFIGVDNE